MSEEFKEEMRMKGEQVAQKVKELLHEGNVRKITIKDREGQTIMVLPLTVGLIGAVAVPMLAAVGAAAALISECSITVERRPASEVEVEEGGLGI